MSPASINHLPNEIHAEILKSLLCQELRPSVTSPSPLLGPVALDCRWEEQDTRSPSLFPFNVASVCKLWQGILIRIPECWTRVVFDVECDPTRFLDAFMWSKSLENLQVLVFSSADDPEQVDHVCEARRVAAIADALLPHVHRCKSIVFDVVYSSSLPPSTIFFCEEAPLLEELLLECEIDDIERRTDVWANPTQPDEEPFPPSFPNLHKLSLTGFWFMYLALHMPEWLKRVRTGKYRTATLFVSRFAFLNRGFLVLPTFVYYLSKARVFQELHLSDLSLSYNYEDTPHQCDTHTQEISQDDIHFEAVSKDFLSHFYALARIKSFDSQSFTECEIPIIRQAQHGSHLKLQNIIDPGDQNGRSLRNILEVWSGTNLTILSCPSFDDTLLNWLGTESKYAPIHPTTPLTGDTVLHYSHRFSYTQKSFWTFPSEGIDWLTVRNCPNFTSQGMREFIHARNMASKAEDIRNPHRNWWDTEKNAVEFLTVSGQCPGLLREDKKFYKKFWDDLTVDWETKKII